MLILNFLRFLFGYVTFTASGGFPERFINLCNYGKVNLWNLRSGGNEISACTDCTGYKKIRGISKKSGMRVRIKRKHGLPFFLNRHSRRAGIIPGIFICIAVLCILSTRIWSIEVIGNEKVSHEEITGVFEQLGVRKGTARDRIDIKAVEIEALRRLDDILWLNINIDGSSAVIEVREREKAENEKNADIPCDIVAARDGQLVILRTFNGTQEQTVGNAVLKGDLLISGIEENKDKTISFCRADGYAVARTKRKITAVQKNEFNVQRTVSVRKTYIIGFLNFEIPLGKPDKNSYKEKTELKINGVTLPLSITECTQITKSEAGITLGKEKTKLLASLLFYEECAEQLRYVETEKADILFDADESSCTVKGEFVCLENIGKEIAMEIEETG